MLVLCPAAKLALICPPAVAVVDRKAGVEAQSQRAEVKRTMYDGSCGGKPQLCCFKFYVMPHPQDGTFQYAFVQAAAEKKAASLQTEPGQALAFTALTSVTVELLMLTFCLRQFPFSFTVFDMFSFLV